MNMFNTRGELNASSLKDAIAQIAKFASVLDEALPSNAALSSSVSDEKRDELLSRAIMTQEGKVALAQAIN